VNKTIIIMCPTYRRAVDEWKRLSEYPVWINKSKYPLSLTSFLGTTYRFVGETEGQRKIRGCNAEIISIDDFEGFIATEAR